MITRALVKAAAVGLLVISGSAFADDEISGGSMVVANDEECPSGMVVSGMTGGEGDTTKICVAPNSAEMPHDDIDVGDPDTDS